MTLTWFKNTVVPVMGREIWGVSQGPGDNSGIDKALRGIVCAIPKGGTKGWLFAVDVGGHIWSNRDFTAWCYAEEFAPLLPSWRIR